MASHLTKDALEHLSNNTLLQPVIADYAGIQISSIKTAIERSSKSLTTYRAVKEISESMGVEPEEILIEKKDNND